MENAAILRQFGILHNMLYIVNDENKAILQQFDYELSFRYKRGCG